MIFLHLIGTERNGQLNFMQSLIMLFSLFDILQNGSTVEILSLLQFFCIDRKVLTHLTLKICFLQTNQNSVIISGYTQQTHS